MGILKWMHVYLPEIQFKGSKVQIMTVINHVIDKNCWFRKPFYHAVSKRSEISINYLICESHLKLKTEFFAIVKFG